MYPADESAQQMQNDIHSRLKKIEGQIRGLQGMIAAGQDCEQILTQTRAAQSALKAVYKLVLKVYLAKCYGESAKARTPDEVLRHLDQAVGLLSRFVDG